MPPSMKEDIALSHAEPAEHDELDNYFASDSEGEDGLFKNVTKTQSTIFTTTSTITTDHLPATSLPRASKLAKRRKRSDSPAVRFSSVQTREYERVVGDHDDLLGPPLALGWAYNAHDAVDLDAYEKSRVDNRKPEYELVLTPNGRRHKLMNEFGISAAHITQAERTLAEQRRTNELAASISESADRKKKERSGSILKRARRKIGKRLSLDRASDLGSSFMAMSGPFTSVYASAR
eukprot:CAMPEP_0181056744 /NCGR_PEP_ID=MMETSP1070-20121207/19880_1 /TAXON_ID=265543 /ORGANISM="Minutocellus polymorphus, Strain NH13" /LENGTH=234 /DNA_ID=CAMNT_0023136111 /DNA_START=48 /DNA_END=752 /DNA_ORIENTATION=-